MWTVRDGFTILSQFGLDDYYNRSTVNSVSDDGRVAVGDMIPASQGPGDPPRVGFVWTADSGLVVVNDLMATTGQPNPDYPSATFVSRDGNRILVTGNPPQATERDTNSLILDLAWSAPRVIGAASSKVHGTAGAFSVSLPLTGPAGIECRAGGATNDYSMVVTFANTVTVTGTPQAQITSGTAEVGSGGVANGGAVTVAGAVVTVPLTNVGNAQRITVMLSGVSDGTNVRDVSIPMSVLVGDTGADGAVSASDVGETKAQSGQAVTDGNFREDVNADGSISASDISLVKAQSGTALP